VEGNQLPGANEFLGIPFAKPTRRFEPPEDFAGHFDTVLAAHDFGPACLQVGDSVDTTYGSEDCLMVNVWQPAGAQQGAKLPVLVFIYGGSNQYGETEPYNGSAMAVRHNVIYASISYRTGPLGWMVFEEDLARGRSTGNWGLLDTQSGLRWIHKEIANFGGDPSKLVIHGQSSGASLVELHLVSPDSKGLLSGLVSESGGLSALSSQSGTQTTLSLAKNFGCQAESVKACMQKLPGLALTNQTYSWTWGPHVDGASIPAQPMALLQQGRINPFNVIMGAQTNDTFREISKQFITSAGVLRGLPVLLYKAAVLQQVGRRHLTRALALYPPDHNDTVQNVHRLGSVSSDKMLCSVKRRVSLVNRIKPASAFMYRFNWWYQSNPACTAEPNFHPSFMGAVHEDEVTFVMGQPIFMFDGACCGKFGTKLLREPCQQKSSCVSCWDPSFGSGYHAYFNEKEWKFSQLVGGFWATFAGTGSPNGLSKNGPWPVFADGEAITQNIVLDADLPHQYVTEATLYNDKRLCEFWDVVSQDTQGDDSDTGYTVTV